MSSGGWNLVGFNKETSLETSPAYSLLQYTALELLRHILLGIRLKMRLTNQRGEKSRLPTSGFAQEAKYFVGYKDCNCTVDADFICRNHV